MPNYGLTDKGPNIKRLDVILKEMHTDLSEKWGVNTQQNPQSFLNTILTNIADAIAELWEYGEDIYYSQYPSTAEGISLDNAGQYTGVIRENEAPSYYHILCSGVDGTIIPAGTIIATDANPATNLRLVRQQVISRTGFNTVAIRANAVDGNPFTVALNGKNYSVTTESQTSEYDALKKLMEVIDDQDFDISMSEQTEETPLLYLNAKDPLTINTLILSDNLTTQSVGCVFTFATENTGDIYLPGGTVTKIIRAVAGLESVTNVGGYIAGREDETDVEFRQSYIDKIFGHSSRMIDSIRSAIINNCQGIKAIAVYENDSNQTDEYGRYPHSVEVVVDGGDPTEIAQQILNTKAGGISTYGSVEIKLAGEYEEELTIRFNRPTYLEVWFKCTITVSKGAVLPANYTEVIREIIVDKVNSIECGGDVIPQNLFLNEIYEKLSGIGYIDITMGTGKEKPKELTERVVYASVRERVTTRENMIEVLING